MPTVIGFDDTKKKRCTCRNCTAIVEYVPADISERNGRDYSGSADGCTWISCPNCRKEIILTSW